MVFKCQHTNAEAQVPHFQLDPIIKEINKLIQDSEVVLSDLLDLPNNDDLLSKVFDEQQWAEKIIEDYKSIG